MTTVPPGRSTRSISPTGPSGIHELKPLDAQDKFERLVRERQELPADDVGDAIRMVHVEPDAARAGRQEVVVGARAAEDVEYVPEMEVVELRRPRKAAAPAHLSDLPGGEGGHTSRG
jgi:hypothetical protein